MHVQSHLVVILAVCVHLIPALQALVVEPTTLTRRTRLQNKVSDRPHLSMTRKTYSAVSTSSVRRASTLTVLRHSAAATSSTATACRSSSSSGRRPRSRRGAERGRSCRRAASARRVEGSLSWLAVASCSDGCRVAGALGVGWSLGYASCVDGWAGVDVG